MLLAKPGDAQIHLVKVRVLADLDSLDALQQEIDTWLRSDPNPGDFEQVVRLSVNAYGPERALSMARGMRASLRDSTALALDIGDLLARTDEPEAAAEEWSRVIQGDGDDVIAVLRRIRDVRGDTALMFRLIIEALDRDPTTPNRRWAAIRVASEIGWADEVLRLAMKVAPDLPTDARRTFLGEMAQRGESLDAHALRIWAYESLREITTDQERLRDIDFRIGLASLAAGDTARAVEAQTRMAASLPPDSPQRRRVLADVIRVEAGRGDPGVLSTLLTNFRREFAEAPELDDVAATVAAALHRRGFTDAARAALDGVNGPRSSLERAYLHFHEGELDPGLTMLNVALPALSAAEGTEAIQLMVLLGRLGPDAAGVVARSAALDHSGVPGVAADHLVSEVTNLPEPDRSAVLAQAARAADKAGRGEQGALLRRRLIEEYPDAAETSEATLALARWSVTSGDKEEAVALLEGLILARPDSPIVPDARRELQRIRGQIPSGAL